MSEPKPPAAGPSAAGKAIAFRLSMAQASSGMVSGIFLPFYGAWLAWRGLSPGHIALVMSAGYLLRTIMGPASGIIADARNDRRGMMLILYWTMSIGYALMALADSNIAVAIVAVTATTAMGAVNPLLESVCVRLSAPFGFQYGRVRLWASSAFVAMSICGGLLFSHFGTVVVAPMMALFSGCCILSTWLLPAPPTAVARGQLSDGVRRTALETWELLRSTVFLVFLAAASLVQASHAFYYSYGGLHWRALGYSGSLIGILCPLGVVAEILVLMFAHRLVRHFKPVRLLLLGGCAVVLRWTVMAFDPPLTIVILAQFLHGGTFALGHIGAMYFMQRTVPQRLAATAQSLYFVFNAGLVIGLATFVSGRLYPTMGGHTYFLMAAMGLVAIGFTLLLGRMWHGRRIIAETDQVQITTI